MKRFFALVMIVLGGVLFSAQTSFALCTKIQSGTLLDSNGNPIILGYDQYWYNYQAHMFNGLYEHFSRPTPPVTSGDVNLIMKVGLTASVSTPTVVFGVLLDSFKYADRLLRVQIIEQSRPPLP